MVAVGCYVQPPTSWSTIYHIGICTARLSNGMLPHIDLLAPFSFWACRAKNIFFDDVLAVARMNESRVLGLVVRSGIGD